MAAMGKYTFKNPRQQSFSLHPNIIYQLTKFPSSYKGYQKIIKTCKYFYSKNPLVIIDSPNFDGEKWTYDYFKGYYKWSAEKEDYSYSYPYSKHIDLNNPHYRIWLSERLNFERVYYINDIKTLLKNVYRCNLRTLTIHNQDLSFEEFKILTCSRNIAFFNFNNVTVRYNDKKIVPFECIIKELPNVIELFCIYQQNCEQHFTRNTAQDMTKLPPLKNLKIVEIDGLNECIDVQHFCEFLKKQDATYCIYFSSTTSKEYLRDFEAVLEENLANYKIVLDIEQNEIFLYPKKNLSKRSTIALDANPIFLLNVIVAVCICFFLFIIW